MNLLAEAFPDIEVYAASMAQASALGAALAIHQNWNPKPIQNDLIDLKFYKYQLSVAVLSQRVSLLYPFSFYIEIPCLHLFLSPIVDIKTLQIKHWPKHKDRIFLKYD